MSCNCDTYGYCNPDRNPYCYDNCKRGAHSFAEVSSTGWEICEFCGSRRHPERLKAAQERLKGGRYRVQFSVYVEAENIEHAKNIVPFELKKLPRLEFERTVLTQKVANK